MPCSDTMTFELATSASLRAAVPAATRPPGPDDCGKPSGPATSDIAACQARCGDSSVSPGRTTTCSGPRPAQQDCGWKRDERVAPWAGRMASRQSQGSNTWIPAHGPRHRCAPEGDPASLPPPRNLPGLPAPARSRHPFRADRPGPIPWCSGDAALQPEQACWYQRGSLLVQGARRSHASAVSPRSRCVRGRQAWSCYPARAGARGPPNVVLMNSGLTSSASSWKGLHRYAVCDGWMPKDRMAATTAVLNLASRSKMRKRGASSNGNASRSCWTTQAAVGHLVTARCTTRRRAWWTKTRTYRMSKVAVGTVKKSIPTIGAAPFQWTPAVVVVESSGRWQVPPTGRGGSGGVRGGWNCC